MARKGSKAAFNRRMRRKLKKSPKMKKWEYILLGGALIFALAYVVVIGKLGLTVPKNLTPTPTPTAVSSPATSGDPTSLPQLPK